MNGYEDDGPSPDAVALLKDLKGELRRAKKGLTPCERLVVRMIEEEPQ